MIVLNFAPGSPGFFVLKTAHVNYPNWGESIGSLAPLYNNDNLQVAESPSDLYIGHEDRLVRDQSSVLQNLRNSPSMVVCHNCNLIPFISEIRTNNKLFSITCDTLEEKMQRDFIMWVRDSKHMFSYVDSNNQDMDFYQAVYQQIWVCAFRVNLQEGTCIQFDDLSNFSSLRPWLDAVKNEFNLTESDSPDTESWYNDSYAKLIKPLDAFSDFYQDFKDVYQQILSVAPPVEKNYQSVLSNANQANLKTIVDFFKLGYDEKNYSNLVV